MRWNHIGFAAVAAGALGMMVAATPASADIVYDSSITALGQGFGANPRLLTVQVSPSNDTTPPGPGNESGCVGFSGTTGSAQCEGATFQPTAPVSVGGQEASNGNDNKNDSALLSASQITNASQIVLVYNPSETGNAAEGQDGPGSTIADVTLKFYDAAGNLIISVDNGAPLVFDDTGTNLGNGGTGFALVLDDAQAAAVNTACAATATTFGNCTTIAMEATILNVNDGPDSFVLANSGAVCNENCTPVPEPASLAVLGSALAGFGWLIHRRRRNDV